MRGGSAASHQVGGERWRAELAGMLAVELELGGWSPGRQRSPAPPSSPACSWSSSSSAAGHQGRWRSPARPSSLACSVARRLATRSAASAGAPSSAAGQVGGDHRRSNSAAVELGAVFLVELERGWSPGRQCSWSSLSAVAREPGRRRSPARSSLPGVLLRSPVPGVLLRSPARSSSPAVAPCSWVNLERRQQIASFEGPQDGLDRPLFDLEKGLSPTPKERIASELEFVRDAVDQLLDKFHLNLV